MTHFHWDNLAHLDGPLHRLDARVKVLAALGLLVLAVSIPPEKKAVFLGFALLWAFILGSSRVPWRRLAVGLLVVAPFLAMTSLFWLLPGAPAFQRGLYIAAAVKSVFGVLLIAVLMSTTRFSDLLEALRRLKAPPLLVRLLGLTYRFLFVFTEEASRMRRSLTARAFRGRWLGQAPVVGRMVGVLFLRAYERGERVHLAMAARGYGQEPPLPSAPLPGFRDILPAGLLLAVAAALRFIA